MFYGSSSLTLVQESTKEGYDFQKQVSYTNLNDYHTLVKDRNYSRCLVVMGIWNNRIIPMVDCDSIENYKSAISYLSKREIECAVFQSSPGHYWIFPDMSFNTVEVAGEFIKLIPGCDIRYVKFVSKRKFFAIRGELKRIDEKPKLLYNDCSEVNIVGFVEALKEHFKSAKIADIAKIKFLKPKPKPEKKISDGWDY